MTKPKTKQVVSMKEILREALAEFLGTFILMIFGMGSVAQLILSEGKIGSADQVRWSWGFGVAFGVYVSGGVSGGHLNPAVTFTLCLFKRVPWKKLPFYMAGQYLGSFIASCMVFAVYYDALNAYKDGNRTIETAGIFATYPQAFLTVGNGFLDQVFGTGVLMLVVLALTDPNNMAPSKGYIPVLVGFLVVVIGMTYSHNCGYAINPARDLAPRLFTLTAGWGTKVFSHNNYRWFWIPVLGPHVGAILGGAAYEMCINCRIPCVLTDAPSTTESRGIDDSVTTVSANQHAQPVDEILKANAATQDDVSLRERKSNLETGGAGQRKD